MEKEQKYVPTPEELKQAEGMMNEEESDHSKEREKDWLMTYKEGMEYDVAKFRNAIQKKWPSEEYEIKEGIASAAALHLEKITPEEDKNYPGAEIYTKGGKWVASVVGTDEKILGEDSSQWGGKHIEFNY